MSAPHESFGNTNAVTHGIRSTRALLLPGERQEEFQALLDSYFEELSPQGEAERDAVIRVASLRWKARRADAHEDALLRAELALQLDGSLEMEAARIVRDATTLTSGLREMFPIFKSASPRKVQATILKAIPALMSLVEACCSRVEMAPGVLAELKHADDELRFAFLADDETEVGGEPKPGPAYLAALASLDTAAAKTLEVLGAMSAKVENALTSKAESLRFMIRLKVSEVRTLDRYRVALERSIERELGHLRTLKEIRAQSETPFGSGMPRSVAPKLELQVAR